MGSAGAGRWQQGLTDLPVVTGLDLGHTDPMWTLPVGATARVDPSSTQIELLTSAVT